MVHSWRSPPLRQAIASLFRSRYVATIACKRLRNVLRTYAAIVRCARMGFSTVNVNAFSPQPHTELYGQLVASGRIVLDDPYFYSLFTFQDQGRWHTSYNERFADWQLSVLVKFGVVLFLLTSFACRPWRLVQVMVEPFQRRSHSKLGKYLRAMRMDYLRTLRARRVRSGESPS